MKVQITRVYKTNVDKNGNLLKTADNRPYERVGIQTEEYKDRWISGFGSRATQDWQKGDIVEIEVKEVQKNGQIYLNFETPSRLDLLEKRVRVLEVQIKALLPQRSEDIPDEKDLPF